MFGQTTGVSKNWIRLSRVQADGQYRGCWKAKLHAGHTGHPWNWYVCSMLGQAEQQLLPGWQRAALAAASLPRTTKSKSVEPV